MGWDPGTATVALLVAFYVVWPASIVVLAVEAVRRRSGPLLQTCVAIQALMCAYLVWDGLWAPALVALAALGLGVAALRRAARSA